MSEIIFQENDYKVPLTLGVKVDGESVTYNKVDGGIHFTVWLGDTGKALSIVNKIISQMKAWYDDQGYGVSWKTISVEVTEESAWYVCVDCYVRDAG